MKTLFNESVNAEIISRLEKLTPTSKPIWGRMKVEQMLTHLYLSFQVNIGVIELNRSLLGIFFKGIARKVLLGEKPLPRHLPTDKKVLAKGPTEFYEEKQKVKEIVQAYLIRGPSILSKKPHNILGKITPEESAFISYKHLDHHLRQFGV